MPVIQKKTPYRYFEGGYNKSISLFYQTRISVNSELCQILQNGNPKFWKESSQLIVVMSSLYFLQLVIFNRIS